MPPATRMNDHFPRHPLSPSGLRKDRTLCAPPPPAAGLGRRGAVPDRGTVILSLVLALFCLAALLSPAAVRAARLAGEEEPVSTVPQRTTAAPAARPANPVPNQDRAAAASVPAAGTAAQQEAAPAAGEPAAADTAAEPAASEPQPATMAPPVAEPQEAPALPPPPEAPASPAAQPAPAPLPGAAPGRTPAAAPPVGKFVTIDFDGVDIQVFIKFVSELTGKNFVIDDKVRGKVTVISPKKIAVKDVYKLFESVMDIYGIATVPAGDVIKVIPALDARSKNLELRLKREPVVPEDRIVTQILSLRHANPDEVKKVLDPLIAKTSIILSYPPTGTLIITDALSNIQRLQDIVTALDVDGVGEMIAYLPLRYASANDLLKSLLAVFQQQPTKGAQASIKIVADDRSNALIVLGSENDIARLRELLKLMDKEIPRGQGLIRVYYLQNARAEDLAKVLTGIPQTKATDPKATQTATTVFSKNVQIMADKATNALIITADPADYLIIEDVIRQLDISRAMVYLEGLIMEVNADKSFGIGVEWSAIKDVGATGVGNDGSRNVGIVGFQGTPIIPQFDASQRLSMPGGFALGVIGAGINITVGGQTLLFPNIGAVLQAFQSDTDIRILSTPQLLTLDNEDAEITVGSNVPYVVRQDTTIGTTTNYSNYEYKDVGVTLKVTPQINKEGFVRLKLDQSVTKIVSQSAALNAAGTSLVLAPTTLKRTAKTTVTVKSGETVVIGGMIQDDSQDGVSKVPFLGDIPLLGWLFKTKSTSTVKTNLFIFITPRIIEKPQDAGKIMDEKMGHMRVLQEGTIRTKPAGRGEGAGAAAGSGNGARPAQ